MIETRTIPATGHNTGAWQTVTAATCTSEGQEQRTCGTCGVVVETRVIPMLDHTEGAWVTGMAAGCLTTDCSVCAAQGLVDPHIVDYDPATFEYSCRICGTLTTDDFVIGAIQ